MVRQLLIDVVLALACGATLLATASGADVDPHSAALKMQEYGQEITVA